MGVLIVLQGLEGVAMLMIGDAKKANRYIATYVEYNSEMPTVPSWCPICMKEGNK